MQIKALQHELSCKVAVLKVKDSEVEVRECLTELFFYYISCNVFILKYCLQLKNKTANQRRKELKSQVGSKFISTIRGELKFTFLIHNYYNSELYCLIL